MNPRRVGSIHSRRRTFDTSLRHGPLKIEPPGGAMNGFQPVSPRRVRPDAPPRNTTYSSRRPKPQAAPRRSVMPKDKDTGFDFASLSIRDLLEARDLYHFHLLNKANVIGTAIGRYLIRDEE